MSVPKLRFKEFKGNWEETTLGNVSNNVMYGMNAAAIAFDGENKYIRITDIDDASRTYLPSPLSSPSGKIEAKFKLSYGDIVFTRTGASVGKAYLYNPKDGNLFFAGFLVRFSVVLGNPYFVFSQTLTNSYWSYVKATSMRSGQPGINAEEYKGFKFFVPSIQEQTKIADFLMAVDEKIVQLTQKCELLARYKKGVMQQIFSQELRFKDDDGRDFPDWEEKKLKDIATRVTRKNKEDNKNVLTISAQQGLINQEEFFNKSVSAKDVRNYYLIHESEFAYNKSYSNGYPMGAIKCLNRYKKGVVSTLYICFKFQDGNVNSFFEQYFESGLQNQEIEKVAQEGARNHGLLNIGLDDFFSIYLIVPSFQEQIKIANFLTSIDKKITEAQTYLDIVKQYKQGLLQQMFV